jgi:hypothetical protein
MKSKERHKLQHNVLADWIAKGIAAAKPYQGFVLIAVLAIVLVAVGYSSWKRMASASTTDAWNELNTALAGDDISKLSDVVSNFPKTSAATVSALVLGDWHLLNGCNALFTDKATANKEFGEATTNYELVLSRSHISTERERATFGLARLHESKGELGQAVLLYKEILTKWPEGAFSKEAKSRVDDLDKPSIKEFYDQFAQFNPKPAVSPEGGKVFSGIGDIPGEPPTSEPAAADAVKMEGSKDAAKPAADAAPAAEQKPAETAPAAEKPAAEAPKTEAPKTDAPAPEAKPAEAGK